MSQIQFKAAFEEDRYFTNQVYNVMVPNNDNTTTANWFILKQEEFIYLDTLPKDN